MNGSILIEFIVALDKLIFFYILHHSFRSEERSNDKRKFMIWVISSLFLSFWFLDQSAYRNSFWTNERTACWR
jgi:amino acid transporter